MNLEEAKRILGKFRNDTVERYRFEKIDYNQYFPLDNSICLDGVYTLNQLEALVIFMRDREGKT